MRGGIAGKIARVHADTIDDAHEVGHRRALETRARRLFVFLHVDVRHHDIAGIINVIAVSA